MVAQWIECTSWLNHLLSCVVLGNHVISLSVLQFFIVGSNIYVKGVSEKAEELKCKGFRIVGMW